MKLSLKNWKDIISAIALATGTANATDLVWTGGTGNWNAAANWSPAQVPTASDNAWITNNGTYTVTVPVGTTATTGSLVVGGASGTQTVAIDRATLTLTGASVVSPNGQLTFLVSQSVLNGAGNLTVNGTLNWANGTMAGTGVTTISSGGVMAIGSGGVTLGRTLNNGGSGTWAGGNLNISANNALNNEAGGTFDITGDGRLSGTATTPINNAGLFRKTGGSGAAGTTDISSAPFINTGIVEVQTNTLRYSLNQQTAGLTLLNGGGLAAQGQPIQLLGGSLVGTGLVSVANTLNVVNSATISPGLPLGELDISGDYQQTASGVLNIELGGDTPGTTYDLVTVSAGGAGGVATLGGTLNVTLTNDFSPTKGATFTFLTAVSRVGSFATFNYPSNDIGMEVSYDATSAKVTVSNLKPVVVNPIANPAPGAYGQVFNFQLPANTFSDPDNDTLTYTASGMPPGISFTGATRTFSGTPTQAGVFNVAVAATDNGTPSLTVTNTLTITITALDITGSFTAAGKVYDGNTSATVLTRTLNGVVAGDTANVSLTGGTASFGDANAGLGKTVTLVGATLTGSAAANYNLTSVGTTTAAIAALGITGSFTAAGKVYDGNTGATVLTRTLNGVLAGDTANVTLAGGAASFGDAKAGTGKPVTLAGATLTGSAAANYILTSVGTTTAAISALEITGSFTAADKVYDGNTSATVLTRTLNGVLAGDTANVSQTGGTASFGDANAGIGKTVTLLGATLAGSAAANYNLTSVGTTTAAITALGITGSFTAAGKVYDGNTSATVLTRTLNGVLAGDTANVILTGGTASFGDANAGIGKTVTLAGATLTGSAAANYNLSSMGTTTAAITALGITGNFTAADKVYDGNTSATVLTRTLNGVVAGDTGNMSLSGGTASFSTATVGVGKTVTLPGATLTGSAAANYNLSSVDPTTATVTAATLVVTADATSKTYGAADPTFTASYAGFVNNETPAVLDGALAFSRAPGENVGSYLITPSGLTSSNYTITFNTGILTITAPAPVILPLVVTATNVVITWSAVSNGNYRVQYRPFLNATNWTDLTGDVLSSGSTASKTDIETPTNRFYRVQVVP